MAAPLSPEEIERLARKRAGAKLFWYVHAAVYVLVNLVIDLFYPLFDPRVAAE